jgi:hypothetical protein
MVRVLDSQREKKDDTLFSLNTLEEKHQGRLKRPAIVAKSGGTHQHVILTWKPVMK